MVTLYMQALPMLANMPTSQNTYLYNGFVDQVLTDDGSSAQARVCNLGGCCVHRLHGMKPRKTRKGSFNFQ